MHKVEALTLVTLLAGGEEKWGQAGATGALLLGVQQGLLTPLLGV